MARWSGRQKFSIGARSKVKAGGGQLSILKTQTVNFKTNNPNN